MAIAEESCCTWNAPFSSANPSNIGNERLGQSSVYFFQVEGYKRTPTPVKTIQPPSNTPIHSMGLEYTSAYIDPPGTTPTDRHIGILWQSHMGRVWVHSSNPPTKLPGCAGSGCSTSSYIPDQTMSGTGIHRFTYLDPTPRGALSGSL